MGLIFKHLERNLAAAALGKVPLHGQFVLDIEGRIMADHHLAGLVLCAVASPHQPHISVRECHGALPHMHYWWRRSEKQ